MSRIPIATVREDDFVAEAALEGDVSQLELVGKADLNVLAAFEQFVDAVHEHTLRLRLQVVRVDLRRLEFMNSSCLRCLIRWVGQIQALDPARRYRIILRSNPGIVWQRRSLVALTLMANDLLQIDSGQG
jgi:hypothetical protein